MTEKLRRHPTVKAKILPDGHVGLQMSNTDWVYILTPLGGAVWEFSDGTNDVDEIFSHITQLEGVEADASLKQQIADLVDELQKVCLLVPDGYEAPDPASGLVGEGCGNTWHPQREVETTAS